MAAPKIKPTPEEQRALEEQRRIIIELEYMLEQAKKLMPKPTTEHMGRRENEDVIKQLLTTMSMMKEFKNKFEGKVLKDPAMRKAITMSMVAIAMMQNKLKDPNFAKRMDPKLANKMMNQLVFVLLTQDAASQKKILAELKLTLASKLTPKEMKNLDKLLKLDKSMKNKKGINAEDDMTHVFAAFFALHQLTLDPKKEMAKEPEQEPIPKALASLMGWSEEPDPLAKRGLLLEGALEEGEESAVKWQEEFEESAKYAEKHHPTLEKHAFSLEGLAQLLDFGKSDKELEIGKGIAPSEPPTEDAVIKTRSPFPDLRATPKLTRDEE